MQGIAPGDTALVWILASGHPHSLTFSASHRLWSCQGTGKGFVTCFVTARSYCGSHRLSGVLSAKLLSF